MQMQIKLYEELKTKGAVKVVRLTEKTAAFVINRFDPATGLRVDPAVEQIDIGEMITMRDNAQKQLDGLNAALDDINAAPVATK